MLSATPQSRLKLLLSLDCTVLPTSTADDARALIAKVASLLKSKASMRFQGKVLLSTFGGESASFGTMGWEGWLQALRAELGDEVRLYLAPLGKADV
jgi:glucan endo-1,3-alpha-glucosidase